MPALPLRIIADTNLWVSYFLGQNMKARLEKILFNPDFILLASTESLRELESILARPKFARYISATQIRELLEAIEIRAEIVSVRSPVTASLDRKDDFLLALCRDGHADYLITGDLDLLVLEQFNGTKILKLTDFENLAGLL